jgi:hypothetical protein
MSTNHFKEDINQKAKQITNVDQLEKEIWRLKLRIKTLETDWETNNEKLKENFVAIFLHSLSKKLKESNQMWIKLVQMGIQNPSFQEFINRINKRISDKWKSFFSKRQQF